MSGLTLSPCVVQSDRAGSAEARRRARLRTLRRRELTAPNPRSCRPSGDHGFRSDVVPPQTGSFVTAPCAHGEIGPNRDCGFTESDDALHGCVPGEMVKLTCSATDTPAILRICDQSDKLGAIACTQAESVNALIRTRTTKVTFVCPAIRDGAAGAGGYSMFEAPLLPSQHVGQVSCTDRRDDR